MDGAARTGEQRWMELRELAPSEGERRYLQNVRVTKDKAYGPVSLALCHEEGEADPWFIATDQKADYLTLRTYSRQRRNFCDRIEELFGDLQGGGFHLHRSRIYHTNRLSRLVLALSWVYTWPGACGRVGCQKGLAFKGRPHRSPRPELRGDWPALATAMYDQWPPPSGRPQTLFLKTVR